MGKKKNSKRKEKAEEVEKPQDMKQSVLPFPWKDASKNSMRGQSHSKGPSGRMGCAVVSAPLGCGCDGFVVGGYNEEGSNEEIWKFSVDTNTWARVRIKSGTGPYPRIMTKYCSLTSNESVSLFLFGGTNENGENVNDLWSVVLNAEPPVRWKNVKLECLDSNAPEISELCTLPTPRCNHAMTSLVIEGSGNDLIFIHGGECDLVPLPLDDLWVIEVTGDRSAKCVEATNKDKSFIAGQAPSPRCSHEAAPLSSSQCIVFFGGVGVPIFNQEPVAETSNVAVEGACACDDGKDETMDGIMPLNDLFILHLGLGCNSAFGSNVFFSGWRWSSISVGDAAIAPSPRSLPSLAVSVGTLGETVHVFGGYGLFEDLKDEINESDGEESVIQIGYLNDLWAFNLSMNKWVCSTDSSAKLEVDASGGGETIEPLTSRNGHGLCVTNSGLVSFGGYSGDRFLDELLCAPCDWADHYLTQSIEDDEEEVQSLLENMGESLSFDDDDQEVVDDPGECDTEDSHVDTIVGLAENLDIAETHAAASQEDDDGDEEEEDSDDEDVEIKDLKVKIRMWEFSQNDPKRDSGSKLVRCGMAKTLKVNQSFTGIVLSSEASTVLSPADLAVVLEKGIGGVNCSWNRLNEVRLCTC
jgi:hypothetical protein